MKHTPFAALPPSERQAVVDALSASGVAMRDVCVSTLELAAADAGDSACCLATISTRDWNATYDTRGAWIAQLKQDLDRLTPASAPEPAQS